MWAVCRFRDNVASLDDEKGIHIALGPHHVSSVVDWACLHPCVCW